MSERLEAAHRPGQEASGAPEAEFFSRRVVRPLPEDANQVRRENYWMPRQSVEVRTRENAAEVAEDERKRAARAQAFNEAWESHHERYVGRLEAEQDYHTSVSQVLSNLNAGNREDRKTILETAKGVYHSDKATYYTLQAAFNKTREVYSQEYHQNGIFKRLFMSESSPTKRAMETALQETKNKGNAYVMGEVLLKHNKIREKFSARSDLMEHEITWDLLKDRIFRNQLTDTAYKYDDKAKKFIPKNEEAAYQARNYGYQPVRRRQDQWATEARYWRDEHVRVNRAANTVDAIELRRRLRDSVEETPIIYETPYERPPSYASTQNQRPGGTSSEYWRESASDAAPAVAGPSQGRRESGIAGPRRVTL